MSEGSVQSKLRNRTEVRSAVSGTAVAVHARKLYNSARPVATTCICACWSHVMYQAVFS